MEFSFLKDKSRIVDYCDKTIEIFLYILIFALPFSKAIIEISASLIILSWIVKRIFSYRLSGGKVGLLNLIKIFKPTSTYLNIPILGYILTTFLSVIFSSRFGLSFKNFGTKMMEYIMLYFIVAEVVSDKKILKNVIIVMLVSAFMIGIDCLFQYVFGFDFLRLRSLEAGRITGSFQMPGDLAGFLGPMLCLCLSLSLLRLKRGIKYFIRLETILLFSLLFISLARAAWVGFMIAVCFLGLLENKKIIYITFGFLLVLGLVVPLLIKMPDSILGRLKSMFVLSDVSSLDRKTIWKAALLMIKDRPVFGHGFTTFMSNFPKYGKDYYYLNQGLIPYAHNCYLQIAAETGIVGLASFLWLIGTFFIKSIEYLRRIQDKFRHAVLAGISAGIIAILVHSAVDTILYSLQLSVLFWLMLGINAGLQCKLKLIDKAG